MYRTVHGSQPLSGEVRRVDVSDPFDLEERRAWTLLEILEDCIVIGNPYNGALIPRKSSPQFQQAVTAAVLSAELGISLQHAERHYVRKLPAEEPHVPEPYAVFQEAYFLATNHIEATIARFRSRGQEPAKAGVVYADAALRRLQGTFYSAGLLFRIGFMFEARAVARTILEQVAWAYAVRNLEDAQIAKNVSATKSITELKSLLPSVGRLYGELSSDTHLGLLEHRRFLDLSGTRAKVKLTHGARSLHSGLVLLDLADYWAVVYEVTQKDYMTALENWETSDGQLQLRADRPFLRQVEAIRRKFEKAMACHSGGYPS